MAIQLSIVDKIVEVTTPTTEVTIQELTNTIRDWEDELENLAYDKVIDAVGKSSLGGGVVTGIVMTLNSEWQVQFWGGSGYTVVKGGTLVGGVGDKPIKATGTADDITVQIQPTDSTIVTASGGGAPSVEEITAGIWNAKILQYQGANSTGERLRSYPSGSTTQIVQRGLNKDERERIVGPIKSLEGEVRGLRDKLDKFGVIIEDKSIVDSAIEQGKAQTRKEVRVMLSEELEELSLSSKDTRLKLIGLTTKVQRMGTRMKGIGSMGGSGANKVNKGDALAKQAKQVNDVKEFEELTRKLDELSGGLEDIIYIISKTIDNEVLDKLVDENLDDEKERNQK